MAIRSFSGRQKKDALDKILGGLKIAQGAFGIVSDIKKFEQGIAQAEIVAKEEERAAALATRGAMEADRTQRGVISQQEQQRQGARLSQQGQEGAVEQTVINPQTGQEEQRFMLMPRIKGARLLPGERANLAKEKSEELANRTKDQKMADLTTEGKKRLDDLLLAQSGITDVFDAIEAGENKFSMVGDNKYTFGVKKFKEGIGRMQSGGMIGKEEGEDFVALLPTSLDDREAVRTKIRSMRDEIARRTETLGFKTSEFPKLFPHEGRDLKIPGLFGGETEKPKRTLEDKKKFLRGEI